MPCAAPSLYALDPAMPVLLRPDGAVQVGWDPRRAVLVRPPNGLAAAALAALLRSMRSPIPITELQRQAADRGLKDADGLTNLVAQLVGAGVATRACRQSGGRAASIRVHGRGPLSDLLVEALRCSGARIAHSSQPHATVSPAAVDLVVLADYLVADPRMVRDLHSQGVPHLAVRVRDGTGLVGPLVIPGVFTAMQAWGSNPALAGKTRRGKSRHITRIVLKCAHGVLTGEGRSEGNPDQLLNAAFLALMVIERALACPHDLTQTGTATSQARTGEGRNDGKESPPMERTR
jgi:hypothetical protein